jgi:1,2-diacylglycerol-3-alpha-glucose alpha-1,2-glucosyltransferase
MKVCLYLEFYHFLGGIFFKKIGTGLLSSYKNQKKILNILNVPYSEKFDDSCDILQINTPWLNSIRLIKKARRRGKKIIIWSHVTAEDTQQVFRVFSYLFPLIKRYLKYAYGLADIVLCPSEYTKSLLLAYGLPESKLVVQSNGVDTKKFYKDLTKRKKERDRRNLQEVVLGTVGLAIPRKGVGDFLNLAKKFPRNSFLWYGKIYNKVMVKALPKKTPPNAVFTGYVDDILAAFNSLDVFIFPSFEENQGMVILEAAAVGLPILVRDIPVYNGWLRHGDNCLKAKSSREFELHLQKLIEDNELRKKLGEKALLLAKDNSLQSIAEKIKVIYRDLLVNEKNN